MICYNDTCPTNVQSKPGKSAPSNDMMFNTCQGKLNNDVQYDTDTGVTTNDVQSDTDTGVTTNDVQSNTDTGVTTNDDQSSTDTGVTTNDVQYDTDTGVTTNDDQSSTDTGVTTKDDQSNTVTGVTTNDVQYDTVTGVTTNDVQYDTVTGVTTNDVQYDTVTGVTTNDVQSHIDTGVTNNDVQSDTDTGVTTNDVQSDTDTGVTTNNVQSDRGVTTNNVQSDTGVTTNDVQSNTDTGVTTSDVQSNTDTGVTTNDVQSDTGVTTNDVQSDTSVTTNDTQSDTGVTTNDIQFDAGRKVPSQEVQCSPCSPVLTFDLRGPVEEYLLCPTCISMSMTGEFVVSDTESCFVVIYSSAGLYLSHFSTIPKRMFYMFIDIAKYRPQDVAWLASKHIVYTQPAGCRVVIADWKGKSTVSIEGRPLYEPYGVCVDKSDKIYITDRAKGRILCYNNDGKLIKSLGVFGSRQVLISPHYIHVTGNGNICVNELIKEGIQVQIYTTTGTSSCLVTKGDNPAIGSIAVDSEGYVLQVDKQFGQLVICRPLKLNGYSQKDRPTKGLNGEKDQNTCLLVSQTLTPNIGAIALTDSDHLVCIDHKDKQVKVYLWNNHKEMLVPL